MRTYYLPGLRSISFGFALALGFTAVAQTPLPDAGARVSPPARTSPLPDSLPADRAQRQASSQPGSADELQLTQEQKEKIAVVVNDENRQIAAVNYDTSLTLEQKQQKAAEIRQAGVLRMKAVLTPEQLQKLDAIVRERERQQDSN